MRRPRNLVNFPRLVNLCMSSFLADNPIFRTSESKIMHFGSPRNLVNFPRLVSEQKLRCHIYRRQVRATLQVPLTGVPGKLLFPITGKNIFPFLETCPQSAPKRVTSWEHARPTLAYSLPSSRDTQWRDFSTSWLVCFYFRFVFPGGGVPVLPALVSQRHYSNASVHLSMISFQCCTVFPCTCIRKYRVEGSQLSVHVNLLIGAVAKRRVEITMPPTNSKTTWNIVRFLQGQACFHRIQLRKFSTTFIFSVCRAIPSRKK